MERFVCPPLHLPLHLPPPLPFPSLSPSLTFLYCVCIYTSAYPPIPLALGHTHTAGLRMCSPTLSYHAHTTGLRVAGVFACVDVGFNFFFSMLVCWYVDMLWFGMIRRVNMVWF